MDRRTKEYKTMIAAQAAEQAAQAARGIQSEESSGVASADDSNPDGEGKKPEPRNEPRRMAMEEIINRDMETKGIPKEELQPVATEPPPSTPGQTPDGGTPTPAPETPPPDETPTPTETPPAPVVETVRVKVDGEEFDVPKTEIEEAGGVPAYRIARANENRLRRTNEVLAKTQAMFAALLKQQTPQTPVVTNDEFIASKIDAIRFGTPEESAAALKEVMQRSNPQIDQNVLIEQAVGEINYREGLAKFRTEFQDLAANPMLMKLVNTVAREKAANIPKDSRTLAGLDWGDFYRRIGNEVRSVVGRPSQPSTASAVPTPGTPSPVTSDKEARKASIVNLPTAAARAELPKETKPETREETLALMRKSRGL